MRKPSPAASLEERHERLTAALRTLREAPTSPAGLKLARWLNSWRGIGAILDGMRAQGWDVEMQDFAGSWSVKFFMSSQSHTAPGGTGWAVTPWAAVQDAAWKTLTTENPAARLEAQLARVNGAARPNPAGGPAGHLQAKRSAHGHSERRRTVTDRAQKSERLLATCGPRRLLTVLASVTYCLRNHRLMTDRELRRWARHPPGIGGT
jgi:hypothetical protein